MIADRWLRERVAEALQPGDSAPRNRDGLRAVLRRLGDRSLLAPHWPRDLGGLDTGLAGSAYVLEQLVLSGYSDTVIVNGVYNVGHALVRHAPLAHGALIRRLAGGRSFATVLFSESGAGSDLAGVRTRAEPAEGGWRLHGEKSWIAQADLCDHGICLARTSGGPGDLAGLRLFLVPLHSPGVTVSLLDATWSEPFFTVAFDDVRLDPSALIAPREDTWELLSELLAMERASPGYYARGVRWRSRLDAAGVAVAPELDDELAVASALSDLAVATPGRIDPVSAAMAKYRGSVAGRRTAEAAVTAGLPDGGRWLAEASGLTLAAGTSEMMLRQIAPAVRELLDDPGRRTRSARQCRLHQALREALADWDEAQPGSARRGWTALDVPASIGGAGRDAEAGAVLGHELGWAVRPPSWLDALLLADLLAATGATGATDQQVGRARDAVAGTGAALVGAPGARDWLAGAVTLRPAGHGLRISTTRTHHALLAPGPTLLLIPAERDGRRCLALLDVPAGPATGGPALLEVAVHGAVVRPEDLVALPDVDSWAQLATRALLRHTAYLLGLAGRALHEAERAGEARVQFGRPVGRRQAVAFPLADLATQVVGERRLLWSACHGDRSDAARRYAAARRLALAAATFAAHVAGAQSLLRDNLAGRIRDMVAGSAGHPVGAVAVDSVRLRAAESPARPPREGVAMATLCVPEAFRRQAVATPDAVAVRTAQATHTYRELAARADAIAGPVAARGLPAESIVGVALPPGMDLVAAMIAVMRCGHAVLLVPLEEPEARLRDMLAAARPALVITDHAARVPAGPAGRPQLLLTRHPAAPPGPLPSPATHPDRLAYVMFTSGSAGRPKGVMVSHRSLAGRLAWDRERAPLDAGDIVLSHTPVGFDPFLWEIFAPLTMGASVHLAEAGERSDLVRLTELIVGQGITAITVLPANLAEILRNVPDDLGRSRLRLVQCGGERVPIALADAVRERLGARVFNCYGLTETAIDACIGEYLGDQSAGDVDVLLGEAVPGTWLEVLHDDGTSAHPGVVGELCVGGASLARGYLHDSRLTASRFRPDPTGDRPGARIFHTGDTVRRFVRDTKEFTGRQDDEIKVRGHRFHPTEVKSELRSADTVADAVAGVGPDGRLVAAITRTRTDRELPDLRARLRTRLPTALIPAHIAVLKTFPLLASGKIDRRAVVVEAASAAAPAAGDTGNGSSASQHGPAAAPRLLVCSVLGLSPDHGLDADFFTLGGDSLQAAKIVRALRQSVASTAGIASLLAATDVADWLTLATTGGGTGDAAS